MYNEDTEARLNQYTEDEKRNFLNDMKKVYEESKLRPIETQYGFPQQYLATPEYMYDLWVSNKRAVHERLGMGGIEYLSKEQVRERCVMVLSSATYSRNGVRFPKGVYYYYQSLAQMDEGDARGWFQKVY